MATTYCSTNTGRDAYLYRNTGTVGTPVWTEVPEARDLSMPMTSEKIKQSDRSTIFALYDNGEIDLSISGALSFRSQNANCTALRDLMLTKCAEQMALMSGPIADSGSEGILAGFKVFTNSHNFPLSDGMTVDIELAPCYYEDPTAPGVQIAPEWYEVA